MMTPTELQMLRNADPGAVLPGIDTPVGDQIAPSSLKPLAAISTAWSASAMRYSPTTNTVYIFQNGADVSGYNFGTATVAVEANNVTIENCTFSGTTGWYAVQEYSGHTGLTVKNSTFTGGYGTHAAFVSTPWTSSNTITGNWFIAASGDAIDATGTIAGNYFEGGGYSSIHSDAIWVTNSSVPTTISNNLIDWTYNLGAGTVGNAVRVTTELGSVSNVTVANNFLFGGSYTIDAGNKVTSGYTYSNIKIAGNYVGFGLYGAFYPGAMRGVTASGNVVFDFTNPVYSGQAWAAYLAAGLPTTNLVVSNGSPTTWAQGAATGSSTVYGAGLPVHISGTSNLTNFVGGAGAQWMWGGTGRNIFTYLAVSDSPVGSQDSIGNFDPAKDVIDLSHLDADLTTPGVQSFKFIGAAPFSGAGGELRFQQDPAHNITYVQADLIGDSSADLSIRLTGLITLAAANFALTPSQSVADFASGTALTPVAAGTTQAQDLAAALAHAPSSLFGITLWDSAGAALGLPGLGAPTISATAPPFRFV